MIGRDEAFKLLNQYLRNEKLLLHSFAVEAILKEMAKLLHEDEDMWGLTGLLHDLDYEYTIDEPERHASVSGQMLEGLIPDEAVNAIRAHNFKYTETLPISRLDKALIAADAVSGLVIATALVVPSKKLVDVKLETLTNKFKDKSFATGCDRKRIEVCDDAGIPLERFLQLSLQACTSIAPTLHL